MSTWAGDGKNPFKMKVLVNVVGYEVYTTAERENRC